MLLKEIKDLAEAGKVYTIRNPDIKPRGAPEKEAPKSGRTYTVGVLDDDMLLKEIKALKTVKGQDRFGNPIPGKDLYDERRVYVVDKELKTLGDFMSMEAATRAMKNNPTRFAGMKIKSGKELNKVFHASIGEEQKVLLKLADYSSPKTFWDGKSWMAARSNAKPLTKAQASELQRKYKTKSFSLSEEALETKSAEDLWNDNKDSVKSYSTNTTYAVRALPDTSPTKYEVFSIIGDQRKLIGKFDSATLNKKFKPIRPNQKPDVEGFITYVDPAETEAIQYGGDPTKIEFDDGSTQQIEKGDFLIRAVQGSKFSYEIKPESDFETEMKEAD